MEYLTTDKEGIKILIEVLKEKGIRQVVLSPGSRNAPLLVAFAREKQIRHFVVLDERSAAFMALITQASDNRYILRPQDSDYTMLSRKSRDTSDLRSIHTDAGSISAYYKYYTSHR